MLHRALRWPVPPEHLEVDTRTASPADPEVESRTCPAARRSTRASPALACARRPSEMTAFLPTRGCVAASMLAVCLLLPHTCAGAGDIDAGEPSHREPTQVVGDPELGCEAQAAYAFGLKIQHAVRQRDVAAFFALVDGELDRGPMRKDAETRSFDDLFPESWTRATLASEPPCRPTGWRGFMLANGRVWYRGPPFRVFAVNGWIEDKRAPVAPQWTIEGKTLSAECFVYEWDSSDNFEAFAERYKIDIGDLSRHPGRYLGDPIDLLEPVALVDIEVTLWRSVDECGVDRALTGERMSGGQYTVLATAPTKSCRGLAPDLPGECLGARLVKIADHQGSGSLIRYGVYGAFVMDDGETLVFPLRTFPTLNRAWNFVDDHAAPLDRGTDRRAPDRSSANDEADGTSAPPDSRLIARSARRGRWGERTRHSSGNPVRDETVQWHSTRRASLKRGSGEERTPQAAHPAMAPMREKSPERRETHPRTYGFRKLVDLMENSGQFEVKRNEVPVRARMKHLQ